MTVFWSIFYTFNLICASLLQSDARLSNTYYCYMMFYQFYADKTAVTLTDFLTEKCSSASKFWRITVDVCNPASRTRSRKTNHLQGNHGNSSVLRGQLTFLFFYLPRLSEHSAAATWNILGNFDEVYKGGEEQIPCGPK